MIQLEMVTAHLWHVYCSDILIGQVCHPRPQDPFRFAFIGDTWKRTEKNLVWKVINAGNERAAIMNIAQRLRS